MDDTFDDLFDEFLEGPRDIEDEAKRLIEMLVNAEEIVRDIDSDLEGEMDTKLGPPDSIEHYEDEGLFFEERVWNLSHGRLIKVMVVDDPSKLPNYVAPEKPLDEQLKEALEAENFEKAAEIRDKMETAKKS